ncbi:MAG: type 2 family protein [Flavipsychrobacter sp.]|jgi:LEA14-like dessication related protein|nr:type 2 family protein [Flavipsychrobacter sp.]
MKAIKNILLLLAIGFASCKPSKDLVYHSVQNCRVQKAGLTQTTLCMDIRLYNPNKHMIKLKKADVEVFLNHKRLGQMTVNGKYKVASADTFSLPVLLDVDLKNALTNAFQLLSKKDMTVRLAGTIKAGRFGMYKKMPISYEGKQDILTGLKLW